MALTTEERRARNRAAYQRFLQRNPNHNRDRYAANRDAYKNRAQNYRTENRSQVLESRKNYRANNRERLSEENKAWRQANPETVRRNGRTHEARRRALAESASIATLPVTNAVIEERFSLTQGCCYCGADESLTIEHVVALNDGGWHVPSNILGACRSCNSSKQDSPVEQWFRAQPFFSEERWQKIQELTND